MSSKEKGIELPSELGDNLIKCESLKWP